MFEYLDSLDKNARKIDFSNLGLTNLSENAITVLAEFPQLIVLDLSGNSLSALPSNLGQLTRLKELYLGSNEFSDLPDVLEQLSLLTKLDLRYNQLAVLPEAVGRLTQLVTLNLRSNQLTMLPDIMGQLTQLKELILWNNKLTTLPDGVGELAQLNKLDLYNNKISRLPDGVVQLNQLTSLNLNDNKLTKLPDGVGDAIQLTKLSLGGNQLTTLPDSLGQLAQLKELSLGANQLSKLPDVVGHLTQLIRLDLSYNNFSSLPDNVGELIQLKELSLGGNRFIQIPDVIGQLTRLEKLDLRNNQLTVLSDDVGRLTQLTVLNLRSNQLSILPDVIGQLTQLKELDLRNNLLTQLPSVVGQLTQLEELDLRRNKLTRLPNSVGQLTQLTTLSLGSNQLTRLPDGVAQLTQLKILYLRYNLLMALPDGVTRLNQLRKLDLSYNKLTTLPDGFGQLTQLKELFLAGNMLTKLPDVVGKLTQLATLNLAKTKVQDLSSLSGLSQLSSLNCSYCYLTSDFKSIWTMLSLEKLILEQSSIFGIPPELLSKKFDDNCLHRLRVYFHDLEAGKVPVCDVKLIMLGNGRVGKTQICRRLRGEKYDEGVYSTHGIQLTSASLLQTSEQDPSHLWFWNILRRIVSGNNRVRKFLICKFLHGGKFDNEKSSVQQEQIISGSLQQSSAIYPVRLKIWDFGGQDIYHGTHVLFLRSRAIFVVVWTPNMEDKHHHEHGGYVFRNEPLPYWVNYVRKAAGSKSPMLIVQTRCDQAEDEVVRPPVSDAVLGHFSFTPQVLHYSALNNRKRASLDESLREAAVWLLEQNGAKYIGKGWAKVKHDLEKMRDIDQKRMKEDRRFRTLTQFQYREICAEAKGVSDPALLLTYLHDTGVVFYRSGLFDDQIILDQAWALEAIYAVLERDNCYQRLLQRRGRFTRSDLGDFLWNKQKYGIEEQKLFLSMMRSCGICFEHRSADVKYGIEAEYIAPNLLPEQPDAGVQTLISSWDEDGETEAMEFKYDLLFPGLMHAIVAKIGAKAGLAAEYWRDGLYAYEVKTKSRALLELKRDENGWGGVIRIRTQRGQALQLLESLLELIEEEERRFNAYSNKDVNTHVMPERHEVIEDETMPDSELRFGPEPSGKTEYFVSYAWNDIADPRREQIVDRLCERAELRGITIIRDKKHVGLGENIPKFMQRIGRGDRVFVILSEKYLESEFCMYELFEVWRNCRQENEAFLARVRTYSLPCANIGRIEDRLNWAKHWKRRYEGLKSDTHMLGLQDQQGLKYMQEFYIHIGEILATVANTLQPRSFEELEEYGFEDKKNTR